MHANGLSDSTWGVPLGRGQQKGRPIKTGKTAPCAAARALLSLRPHLKPVSLRRGGVLCEADEPLTYVYFVETEA